MFLRKINEHANFFHFRRQLGYNLARGRGLDVTRTALMKHKSHSIRAGFNRSERVLQVRDAANLDPSHRNRRWLMGIRCWREII